MNIKEIPISEEKQYMMYQLYEKYVPDDDWDIYSTKNFILSIHKKLATLYDIKFDEADFILQEFDLMNFSIYPFFHRLFQDIGIYGKITKNIIKDLSKDMQGKIVADVCAGNGWYDLLLNSEGVNITGYDIGDIDFNNEYNKLSNYNRSLYYQVYPIYQCDGSLIPKNSDIDIIFMSWPPYDDDFAYNTLINMHHHQDLIYIGEDIEGCTANDKFFKYLYDNYVLDHTIESYKSFNGLHDEACYYKHK